MEGGSWKQHLMKLEKTTFNQYSIEDWENKAKDALKGKQIESLYSKTYEQITIKPLYTSKDIEQLQIDQYPSEGNNKRGFSKEATTNHWKVILPLKVKDWNQKNDFSQHTYSFQLDLEGNEDQFFNLIETFTHQHETIYVQSLKEWTAFIDLIEKHEHLSSIQGLVAFDPISKELKRGQFPNLKESKWVDRTRSLTKNTDQLKTVLVDIRPYELAGASAIEEIALALLEATYLIDLLGNDELPSENFINRLAFHFHTGSDFFMQIAKFRAFRSLWKTVCEGYRIQKIDPIIATTSSTLTYSLLDEHSNILRAANEAFASIIGGVNHLEVVPFNILTGNSSAQADRLSRNIQLVLKEETHINKVVDPAGGSYFIESLTNEMAKKAWSLFLEWEEVGLEALLSNGTIQHSIQSIHQERQSKVAKREQTIIGVNRYANLDDKLKLNNQIESEKTEESMLYSCVQVPILQINRLAEPFEQLRQKANQIKPEIGLICVGSLKEYKARADFAAEFLSSGGIMAHRSPVCKDTHEINDFIQATKYPYYCICSSDDQYKRLLAEGVFTRIKQNQTCHVDLAGKRSLIEGSEHILDGELYLHQDAIEKLTSILSLWEEK